ncbi:putative oxidoreductase [Paraburkholderia sp. GAS206C]|uniref:SDR family oxidoreductase n=1 Tax=unclassified Paraburkholderia TaxID=2615204 RepID=UPI003D254671
MKLTGNTIFITGGTSGIGRALAEALHQRGNKVIISGRRRGLLDEVVAANPGMAAIELDMTDAASIERAAAQLIRDYPDFNVLINNAGIMQPDSAAGRIDDVLLVSTVETNLIGPIRMTSALLGHLKTKNNAVVAYTTSVLAFVPLAVTAVYSSTKAALHSYIMSQRFMLRDTTVRVLEIAPPWVRTDLMNSREAEQAMPLDAFINETIAVLGTDTDEVLVDAAMLFRGNPGPGEHELVNGFNAQMVEVFGG